MVFRSALSLQVWRVLQSAIGFPPVDKALHDWPVSETRPGDRRSVQKRLHGFIYSLLVVTRTELETIALQKGGNYLLTAPQITCQWRCRCIRVTSTR